MNVNTTKTAREIEIVYKSEVVTMPVTDEGSYYDGTITYQHNLGYVPTVLAQRYNSDPDERFWDNVHTIPYYDYLADDGSFFGVFDYTVDTVQVTFTLFFNFPVVDTSPNRYFRFLLFKEQL